jgi:hypothetical protein
MLHLQPTLPNFPSFVPVRNLHKKITNYVDPDIKRNFRILQWGGGLLLSQIVATCLRGATGGGGGGRQNPVEVN